MTVAFGSEPVTDTEVEAVNGIHGVASIAIVEGGDMVVSFDLAVVKAQTLARLIASMFPGKPVTWA